MILKTFPSAEEFYKTYWGKRPFVVRGFIPEEVIETLVDGDILAGLALEEEVRSRIITNSAAGDGWVCEHGPFEENRFQNLGEQNWSLLVQNVEQYHTDTANLLPYFQLSPRWLLDDIMVSYSAAGGSVGPHTDSYHTFLVQGIGKRTWKISDEIVTDERYVDNPDVKVLAHGFEGETVEVTAGDVIYMPPFFGHEGKTIDTAMTFSVGFLGPKLSEMLGDYAHYLAENEALDKRYFGADLNIDSAGFSLGAAHRSIRSGIAASLQSDEFTAWMATYFATPTHDTLEDIAVPDRSLQKGDVLYKPEHIKLAITTASDGEFYVSALGEVFSLSLDKVSLIKALNAAQDIVIDDAADKETLGLLYSLGALFRR